MAGRWAAWGLALVLVLGACGGKSSGYRDPSAGAGSGGELAAIGGAGNAGGGAGRVVSGGASNDSSGAAGEAGAGYAGSGVRLSTSEWSLTLEAQVAAPSGFPDTGACGLWLTLDLIDDGDSLHAFLGADGNMAEATFNRSPDTDVLTLAAPVDLASLVVACPIASYHLETLSLAPAQGLLDEPDQYSLVSATGSGWAGIPDGDVVDSAPTKFSGQGYTDSTPPSVVADAELHHPLDPISIAISEPLAKAKLRLEGEPIVDFPIPPPDTADIRLQNDQVLPFAQTWQVTGAASDFAGLALATASFKTQQDPGPFAQNGFEDTPVFVTLTGQSLLIDDTYGVPIPSGKRALLVAPDGTATLRLENPAGAAPTLSLSFLELSADAAQPGSGLVYVEAATIGGSQRVRHDFVVTAPFAAINTTQWQVASPAATVVMPLQEKGLNVVVRFVVRGCTDPPCPATALVIDDVKLQ